MKITTKGNDLHVEIPEAQFNRMTSDGVFVFHVFHASPAVPFIRNEAYVEITTEDGVYAGYVDDFEPDTGTVFVELS